MFRYLQNILRNKMKWSFRELFTRAKKVGVESVKYTAVGSGLTVVSGSTLLILELQKDENKSLKRINQTDIFLWASQHDNLSKMTFFLVIASFLQKKPIIFLSQYPFFLKAAYIISSADNLTRPVGDVQVKSFNQNHFIQLVNQYYSRDILSPEGVCSGLNLTHLVYQHMSRDWFAEIQSIEKTINEKNLLTNEQLKFIQLIVDAQREPTSKHLIGEEVIQTRCHARYFVSVPYKCDNSSISDLEAFAKIAIQKSRNSGKSVQILFLSSMAKAEQVSVSTEGIRRTSSYVDHVISLTVNEKDICYFDSNFREAHFDNEENAQRSLAYLLNVYKCFEHNDHTLKFIIEETSIQPMPTNIVGQFFSSIYLGSAQPPLIQLDTEDSQNRQRP